MEKFRLNGTTVEIIRFIVRYKENEEIENEIYISTEDELDLVTARLDNENIEYDIIDVDTSDCWFLDGEIYTGYDEVFAAIEAGEAVFVEAVRSKKLAEIGNACETMIHEGIEITTSEGVERFSLTAADQTNITNLALQAQAGHSVLYHADRKLCRWFEPDEILALAAKATEHVTYHTTLCNHLNVWVRREKDLEALRNITYSSTLPDDLAANMAEVLGGSEG